MNQLFSKVIGNNHQHLIILHGIFGTGDNWQTIGKQLAEKYTVHILDVRNHGKSFHSPEMSYPLLAEDVFLYLKMNGIEKCSIIGHSMGGKITMQAIMDYPTFFEKAVIIDIAPKKYPPQHNEVLVALKSLNLDQIKKRSEISDHLSNYINEIAVIQWLMKSIYLDEDKYKFRFNLDSIVNNYSLLSDSIEINKNKTCSVSTLFIGGEKSNYIEKPNDLLTIESLFPNYEFVEINNAAHWIHVDNPKDFYNSIFNFLVTD